MQNCIQLLVTPEMKNDISWNEFKGDNKLKDLIHIGAHYDFTAWSIND